MKTTTLLQYLAISATLTLTACSSSDDKPSEPGANDESELSEDAQDPVDTGESGGDTTAIAGLWDGTTVANDTNDVVYWHLTDNGVLTRYDYQQDGVATASGENCYLVGDPISVSPEDADAYSLFNVAVTAVRNDQSLTITFIDADKNDVDENGDTTETPTFNWTLLTTPVLSDLNNCVTDTEALTDNETLSSDLDTTSTDEENQSVSDPDEGENNAIIEPANGNDPVDGLEPPQAPSTLLLEMSRAGCISDGGTVIGDIGNGAIFEPEYRCPSGQRPIARVTSLDGEPIATDGEVCCL